MAAVITLSAGTLPPPSCYADEQERLDAYVAAITATLTGGIQWQSSQGAPSDLTLYWLRLDVSNRPVEALKYSTADGAWVRYLDEVIFLGDATGTLGNYQSAPVPQFLTSATAYAYGRMYVFKAPHTNTGAATLNINLLGSRPITRAGAVALVAGDIVVEQMIIVVYDGTNFQMLNPSAQATVSVSNITPGTDRQFLRTSSTPATVWESAYITPEASYQAIPAAGAKVELSHGFSVVPIAWTIGIVCIADTGDLGYAKYDYIDVGGLLRAGLSESDHRTTGYATTSVLGMVRGSLVDFVSINNKGTGVVTAIDTAKWRVMARAIR